MQRRQQLRMLLGPQTTLLALPLLFLLCMAELM
jgi:hypothetical protein